MAKLGIDFFLNKQDIVGIIKNNLRNAKVDNSVRMNYSGDPYRLFVDHKRSLLGIGNFVVGGTLSERTAKKVEQIQNGQFKRDELLYNPVELYRLANEVNYTLNAEGAPQERFKAFKPLNFEMEVLTKWGANLEEVKMNLLLDNFLAFNNIDENHINAEFNEHLVDNALDTYNTLCRYDRFSPYDKLLNMYADYVYETNPVISNKKEMVFNNEIAKFDTSMIKTYAYNKIMCEILKCLMRLRYATGKDSHLDEISGVERREFEYGFCSNPVIRRQFGEGVVDDVYKLATMQKNVSLNELMHYYMSLIGAVQKNFPDINKKNYVEDFSILLTFFSTLKNKINKAQSGSNIDKNNSFDNENDI